MTAGGSKSASSPSSSAGLERGSEKINRRRRRRGESTVQSDISICEADPRRSVRRRASRSSSRSRSRPASARSLCLRALAFPARAHHAASLRPADPRVGCRLQRRLQQSRRFQPVAVHWDRHRRLLSEFIRLLLLAQPRPRHDDSGERPSALKPRARSRSMGASEAGTRRSHAGRRARWPARRSPPRSCGRPTISGLPRCLVRRSSGRLPFVDQRTPFKPIVASSFSGRRRSFG